MGKIYIARSDVYLGAIDTFHEHLFLVYVPDGNPGQPYIGHKAITAGPSNTGVYPPGDFGELISNIDEDLIYLSYSQSPNAPAEYTYTEIYSGSDSGDKWNDMVNYANSLVDNINLSSTGLDYSPAGPNSNSFIGSILNEVGYNPQTTLPDGYSESYFPGLMTFIDGYSDDVIEHDLIGDTYYIADNAGKDFLIIQDGAKAVIGKDDNLAEWNNVVLSGHANLNDLWLNQTGYHLYINDGAQTIVTLEDHFEWIGGARDYNGRYLFVTTDNIGATDINISTDTISNTTVLKQIDLRLLATSDYDLSTAVALSQIITVLPDQPDITGSSLDEAMFGDEFGNEITGAGGNDTLFGGAGNDLLSFSSSSATNYSRAYGGDGFDYYKFTGSSDVQVKSDGTIITQGGVITDVEALNISTTSSSNYIAMEDLGWEFEVNSVSNTSWVDYSSIAESLDLNLDGDWIVTETVGLESDIFLNSNTSAARFIGSRGGDDVVFGNAASQYVWLGTGNDNVSFATISSGNKYIYFSGGTDVIEDAYKLYALYFDSTIQGNDVSLSEINKSPEVINGSGNNIYKQYIYDLRITVAGKGSITLENLTRTISDGADNTFGTSDDSATHNGPNIYLHNSTHFSKDDYSLMGSGSFDTNIGTPFDDTISGAGYLYGRGGDDSIIGDAGNNYLYGETGDDTLSGNAGVDRLYGGLGAVTCPT